MKSFAVRLGEEIAPEQVALGALSEFLGHLSAAVSSFAQARAWESGPDDIISLVDVRAGSTLCVFESRGAPANATDDIVRIIDQRDWAALPDRTHRELLEMVGLARKYEWSPTFVLGPDLGPSSESVELDLDMPGPVRGPALRGSTTLIGVCVRVGGAEPKIDVRLVSTGRIEHLLCSEDLAHRAARRLYEHVVLDADVVWDSETWEVIEYLRATRLAPYRKVDAATAFKNLAAAAGGAWDGVDARKVVASLRGRPKS